jgi:hypothetical protein
LGRGWQHSHSVRSRGRLHSSARSRSSDQALLTWSSRNPSISVPTSLSSRFLRTVLCKQVSPSSSPTLPFLLICYPCLKDEAEVSTRTGPGQDSTGTFGSRSSGPVSFVSNTSSGQPVPKKRGRPRKGEAPSGQIDQKPKRQFLTIGDWGFWLIPKTSEGSTTYAPTQTAVSESWRLRDHIAASDDLNPNWRTRETDISNLLKLFLATADAHAIVQSNQERTPVQDQILFLGDLGQEVYIEINRHMRSIKSGLQDQDSDVYNRGLRWLRLAAPVILQIASVIAASPTE